MNVNEDEDDADEQELWILDSGSSTHLVNDLIILENAQACREKCLLPDGDLLRITKKTSLRARI